MTVWIILMFISMIVLLFMGFPVAFTLGAVALVFGTSILGIGFFDLLPLQIW
ncbi:MAG: C4-dicarboxylate ABC transporter, partial [Gammaproteobacteria bacterium]|nr:C4-dicarboxylate ABC transporter [Gammaproteobacteria bacterium]